jgi:hypothetical protein
MICTIDGCGKRHKAQGLCSAHYTRLRRHGDPLKGGTPFGEPMAWLNAHADHDGQECLPWPFGKNHAGYGKIWTGSKVDLVSRVMCERRHGPPPTPKHEAAHNCGNGRAGCCNPSHLEWKDRTQNQADRVRHGTDNRGEKHYGHKLNSSAVEFIRANPTLPTRALAETFGVRPNTIKAARSGQTWSWITPIHHNGERA